MFANDMLLAATALMGVGIVAFSLLKGWQGWLSLKTAELDRGTPPRPNPARDLDRMAPEGTARIEIADLKERIRKLEAIASGVDL